MKAFLIYIEGHEGSEKQAKSAAESASRNGFDVLMTPGITPNTLELYKKYIEVVNGRVTNFKRENTKTYLTKMSCFFNHIETWKKCVELNEPVAFIEHDSYCVREWNNPHWDEVLIMNMESAFKQPVFSHVSNKPTPSLGVNVYDKSPLNYRFDNDFKGSLMIPGTGAYAVTPKGAKRLLGALNKYGWEQSDFFINTFNVNLEYIIPEYFTFKHSNLNTSHGF
jgi:GR25 family glycosyltransferase involved in LPS biosynthesis